MLGKSRMYLGELASAVALTAAAAGLRWLLDPWLNDRQPFATLYAAVAVAVWFHSYRPALVVAVFGALICDYFFSPPRATLGSANVPVMVAFTTFLLSTAIIIGFGEARRIAQQRAEAERQQSLQRQNQLEQEAEERRRAESTLQIIADAVPSLISYIDRDCRYRLNNRAYETWFGQPQGEMVGRHMGEILGESAWEVIGPHVERALSGETVHYEAAAPYKAGGERWIDVTYTPHVEGGQVRGIVALVNDLTARKQMEESLRRSEERFRALIENSWDGILVLNADGIAEYLSPSIGRILGFAPDDLRGKSVFALLHPDEQAAAESAIAELLARPGGSAGHQFRFRHRDGSWRWMEGMSINLVENPAIRGIVVNFRDVTERIEAERAMHVSEARFHAFMDHNPSTAYIKDGEGRYLYVNRIAEQRFGRSSAEWLGKTDYDLFPSDLAEEYRRNDRAVLESGVPLQTVESVVDAAGNRGSFLSVKFPLQDATGNWLLAGVSFDVTEQKRVENQLRESEEKFRRIVETANEGIWLLDTEARVTFVNQRMAEMLGCRPEEMLGRHKWEFLVEQDQQRIREMFARRRAGISEQLDVCFRHRDGRPVWALMAARPMIDEHGAFHGTLDMFTDVTERKRAEKAVRESERLYRAIGESIDYGIWVCDAEGRNIYASESFLRLVGMTQEECSSFGWGRVLHPDDAERTIAAWKQCVRTMGVWDIEHRFLGVDGTYHPVLARGVPVKDEEGKVVCWAGINLDIGRLKAAEDALRQADRRKDEFLATLAHELRNPLAPIRNAVELLQSDSDSPPASRTARDIIDRQVQHLVRLIDDLLDVSRITRNKLHLRKQQVDLADAIHSAVETSRPLIEASGHALEVRLPAEPAYLDADLTRLAQVFANLLNNAAKYTDPGGDIVLAAERQDGQIVVSVADSGIGIASEQLPYIFEMFSQVTPALDRTQGGLGIGLSLVRSLVEMHGGAIEAHSDGIGRGSRFVVRLPLLAQVEPSVQPAPLGLPAPHARAAGNGRPGGRRILVVDDNQDAARTLAMLLKLSGNSVETAFDGEQAVEMAAKSQPHLILLDIGLPKLNGYEAARRIRATPAGKSVTLVALTGWGQDDDKRRAREAGFDHHLTKPVDIPALENLLCELDVPGIALAGQPS